MTVLHLNISSLSFHINELKLLLSSLNLEFDIICITESRITKSNLPTSNIHIPGYNTEQTPTESSAGGTLIYISQKLSYKNKPDLQIYHPRHLESIFIEILLPDKSNFIIGTVYKHPLMRPYSFNTSFSQLLQKIKKENKKKNSYDNFNLNLLNYAKNIGAYQFLKSIFSNNFTPQINLPAKITGISSTIIDNILINSQENVCTSGNLTTSISDYLPQFTIIENLLSDTSVKKGVKTRKKRLFKVS